MGWNLVFSEPVLITASEDQTLKMWNLQKERISCHFLKFEFCPKSEL
jgi:hypothetical protein